ncbi:tannase/feruloyl esterase family alpha/beta hydrolase [Brevundimonas sp. LF-1]|uniref:tannase/feruloyl esterase family alpha/beta hydrolase n=1 Tax=Brevundimonas sp. LF-1 TaxID=3126100 RepID=UPI0030E29933
MDHRPCGNRLLAGRSVDQHAGASDGALGAAADPAAACSALARLDLTRTADAPATILSATLDEAANGEKPFCKVNGVIMPQIQFEVRLPLGEAWNGRYFQTGCGGFCGTVPVENFADAQRMGFAVAAQNMGHVGSVLNDPLWGESLEMRRDYGRRSSEVVAVTAKKVVEAFYGRAPDYSYFRGAPPVVVKP